MNESIPAAYKLTDTRHPFAGNMKVGKAREEYLAENGFNVAEYTAPTFRLKVLGRYFDVPNSSDRQWAIALHDLHHLATGYGTDLAGEAEIAAFELRAGCRTWVVYYLNVVAACVGLAIAPRRLLAAWRASKGTRSMYRSPVSMEQALSMSVGELREHLGIPAAGLASERHLHEDAEAARRARVGADGSAAAVS